MLTSFRTASADEAVVIAFRGQPGVGVIGTWTAGFTTGNRTYLLSDGTRLRITGAATPATTASPSRGLSPSITTSETQTVACR